jgi:hypothetical protein
MHLCIELLTVSEMQVIVGVPTSEAMAKCAYGTPFGVVLGGFNRCNKGTSTLNEHEVRLAFSLGSWAASVAKQMHDEGT